MLYIHSKSIIATNELSARAPSGVISLFSHVLSILHRLRRQRPIAVTPPTDPVTLRRFNNRFRHDSMVTRFSRD
jgi:hypothetical protein